MSKAGRQVGRPVGFLHRRAARQRQRFFEGGARGLGLAGVAQHHAVHIEQVDARSGRGVGAQRGQAQRHAGGSLVVLATGVEHGGAQFVHIGVLLRRLRQGGQAVDGGSQRRVAGDRAQRQHDRVRRGVGRIPLAGAAAQVGQLAPQARRFGRVQRLGGGLGRALQRRGGAFGLARRQPVRRQRGRCHLALAFKMGRDFAVQVARNGRWHRGQRGLEEQVVHEGLVAQHLRGFELGPGVGQAQRRLTQHARGQTGAEILACHGGAARQRQRRRRQLRQPALDQPCHRQRARQGLLVGQAGQALLDPGLLECFEDEQRVAAGAPPQPRRQRRAIDARQAE